jgi:hypothetical protein
MRIKAMVGMVLALVGSAHAANKVRVCVNPGTYVSAYVLTRSQAIASEMFARAGVAIEWHSAAPAVCRGAQLMKTVILDLVKNTRSDEHPGALAYALPYEAVHVVVMYDRVEKNAEGPTRASSLLAHVMTHEITHILQGIARHSETGVMKPRWSPSDVMQMAYKPLRFTADDIDLIGRGMQSAGAVIAQVH